MGLCSSSKNSEGMLSSPRIIAGSSTNLRSAQPRKAKPKAPLVLDLVESGSEISDSPPHTASKNVTTNDVADDNASDLSSLSSDGNLHDKDLALGVQANSREFVTKERDDKRVEAELQVIETVKYQRKPLGNHRIQSGDFSDDSGVDAVPGPPDTDQDTDASSNNNEDVFIEDDPVLTEVYNSQVLRAKRARNQQLAAPSPRVTASGSPMLPQKTLSVGSPSDSFSIGPRKVKKAAKSQAARPQSSRTPSKKKQTNSASKTPRARSTIKKSFSNGSMSARRASTRPKKKRQPSLIRKLNATTKRERQLAAKLAKKERELQKALNSWEPLKVGKGVKVPNVAFHDAGTFHRKVKQGQSMGSEEDSDEVDADQNGQYEYMDEDEAVRMSQVAAAIVSSDDASSVSSEANGDQTPPPTSLSSHFVDRRGSESVSEYEGLPAPGPPTMPFPTDDENTESEFTDVEFSISAPPPPPMDSDFEDASDSAGPTPLKHAQGNSKSNGAMVATEHNAQPASKQRPLISHSASSPRLSNHQRIQQTAAVVRKFQSSRSSSSLRDDDDASSTSSRMSARRRNRRRNGSSTSLMSVDSQASSKHQRWLTMILQPRAIMLRSCYFRHCILRHSPEKNMTVILTDQRSDLQPEGATYFLREGLHPGVAAVSIESYTDEGSFLTVEGNALKLVRPSRQHFKASSWRKSATFRVKPALWAEAAVNMVTLECMSKIGHYVHGVEGRLVRIDKDKERSAVSKFSKMASFELVNA